MDLYMKVETLLTCALTDTNIVKYRDLFCQSSSDADWKQYLPILCK
jgi:hypothetical protein